MIMDPARIEAESMRRISEELSRRNVRRSEDELQVIRRVIHTTADFDFADTLVFSEDAVGRGREALLGGAALITDTNMALSGISKPSCRKYGNEALCFMAEETIDEAAKAAGTTRAWAAMEHAAKFYPKAVYAVGNAPTALLCLEKLLEGGSFFPSLIIAVPVGFVNVTEAKEQIRAACGRHQVPLIAAMGRKGGSTVCAAIVNALFYGMERSSGRD